MSVIEDVARKLNCKPTDVFRKAAVHFGYIACEQMASIWMSRYLESRSLDAEIVDWAIDILTEKKQLQGGI